VYYCSISEVKEIFTNIVISHIAGICHPAGYSLVMVAMQWQLNINMMSHGCCRWI